MPEIMMGNAVIRIRPLSNTIIYPQTVLERTIQDSSLSSSPAFGLEHYEPTTREHN